jgi:hypothetical protein
MSKLPSEILRYGQHLSITDNDLAWIGAVTAYWAACEQFLDILIGDLVARGPN